MIVTRQVSRKTLDELRLAVVIPCHNEGNAIGAVVRDIRDALPTAEIYVYDNCCDDDTAVRAAEAGAIVRKETNKGKGNVIRRAFADVEADVYLLIDGDGTYEATAAAKMVEELLQGPFDHVLGVRNVVNDDGSPYRPGHEWGNKLLNAIVRWIFRGPAESDMLSGYRVMTRRFVKSFPAVSREFEIETELTIHTLALRVPHTSVNVGFTDRAPGTESKLRTYRDGFKILNLIATLTRHEKPLSFYGVLGALSLLASFVLGVPVAFDYFATGMVPRFPTLFVATMWILLAMLLLITGLILDGSRKTRQELARLQYLDLPGLPDSVDSHVDASSGVPEEQHEPYQEARPVGARERVRTHSAHVAASRTSLV